MIISIDVEKSFDESLTSFHYKTLRKPGIKRELPLHDKGYL